MNYNVRMPNVLLAGGPRAPASTIEEEDYIDDADTIEM